jgi:hypothetical protein
MADRASSVGSLDFLGVLAITVVSRRYADTKLSDFEVEAVARARDGDKLQPAGNPK